MDRRAEKGEAPGTCIAVYCTIPLRQRWTLELPPGGRYNTASGPGLTPYSVG